MLLVHVIGTGFGVKILARFSLLWVDYLHHFQPVFCTVHPAIFLHSAVEYSAVTRIKYKKLFIICIQGSQGRTSVPMLLAIINDEDEQHA